MSKNLGSLIFAAKRLTVAGAVAAAMVWVGTAQAQETRTYNVQKTTNTIVADGVISPGEWDGADAASGNFNELRTDFSDADTDNNRFQMLWDDNNLYILYETDRAADWFTPLAGNTTIAFAEHNLNLYIDPNNDGDLNTDNDGNPLPPGIDNGGNTDGYQFAFNQLEGTNISTADDRGGIGFFTEAHVNSPFGDQAGWNEGGSATNGDALIGSNIVVGSTYTDGAGGLSEIVIPFADLDAAEFIGENLDVETGLNATAGVQAGDVWGWNVGVINLGGDDPFLPIWNWKTGQSFAPWPTGEITFVDGDGGSIADLNMDGFVDGLDLGILLGEWDPPVAAAMGITGGGAVPEPTSAVLVLTGVALAGLRRRR